MKKILLILLAVLMLLGSCGVPNDTSADDGTADDPAITNAPETEPPVKVERFDHTIPVLADTYVFNKDTVDHSDENFGSSTEIHLKNNGKSYHRIGYLKFDISSLAGDNDFTSIELDLTIVARQNDTGNPKNAAIAVYGCDTAWNENEITFNSQPASFSLITKLTDVTNENVTRSYPVTDYIRKALAAGQAEVAFMLCDETPEMGLHIRFASKEAAENSPKISVYYGTKDDNQKYEGVTRIPEPGISKTGIDAILGAEEATSVLVKAIEDTYVQGGSYVNTNFGASDILDFKHDGSVASEYHREMLLKFDIGELKTDNLTKAEIVLNCNSSQNPESERDLNVYACDPYAWDEMTVTMNTVPKKEEKIISLKAGAVGILRINITEYIRQARKNGEKIVAFLIEGSPETRFRMSFDSSQMARGIAPSIEAKYGGISFSTRLKYTDANPWDKAMSDVSAWLGRWETIKNGGNSNATEIAVDKSEYSVVVDACLSGQTNGADTVYSKYDTRLVDTLKGYTASTAETKLYDKYGGYTGNGKYGEATGFFYSKKIGDRWWTIDPLGYPFYRVACVEIAHGSSPNQKSLTLAKFGNVSAWAESATDRMRELGFNSAGGWSDIDNLSKVEQPLAQTKIIYVLSSYAESKELNISKGGSTELLYGILPVFDPDFESFTDARAKSETAGYANSPYIYGWFGDNELPNGKEMLDKSLTLYHEDERFVYSYATAWTFMYLKTGKADVSTDDVTDELRDEYRAMVYDKYFEVVKKALEKYVPNHQFIGIRMSGNAYRTESLIRVAGYWCDIISFNYYSKWTPETDLLCNLEKWSSVPFIITEWYAKGMDAWEADNRMINKSGAGWTVRNQADRGKFYQNFVLGLMEWKNCVGFDWFKYWDNDPDNTSADLSNRDANKGILNNKGNEYTDLTEYMVELNNQKYSLIKFFDER